MKFPQLQSGLLGLLVFFAAAPSSTTFKLETYSTGSGGAANSSSATYSSSSVSGQQGNAGAASSTTFNGQSGLIPTQLSGVPSAPTVTNPSNFYNKLRIVINNGGNPSDATFVIAISPDGFSPTTNYVQSDFTVGATLGAEDWLTYSAWGGGTGFEVIGLLPNTTYTVKVKAQHGKFTESAYSATSSAATVGSTLVFDIDVAATDIETSPPYTMSFGTLTPGSVVNSPARVWVDFETNAQSGGTVFMASANIGLRSAATTYTIASSSADLASLSEGFGAQNASAGQSSGGPLTAQAPYTGVSDNVGITDTTLRSLYVSSAPIVGGRGSVVLKARSTVTTPAAQDYSDTLTLIASASF